MSSVPEPPASALRRFLRYVEPYWLLIVGATLCGILKFTLPAAFAIALRFMTDRLVPQFGQESRPRFSCLSKAALPANQASNSWPRLHLSL